MGHHRDPVFGYLSRLVRVVTANVMAYPAALFQKLEIRYQIVTKTKAPWLAALSVFDSVAGSGHLDGKVDGGVRLNANLDTRLIIVDEPQSSPLA